MIEAWRYVNDLPDRAPVALDELPDSIDPKQGLLWVDCAAPSDAEIDAVVAELKIHGIAAEDLHHGRQRTKLERYPDHFHVAVHDCELVDNELVDREVDVVFGEGWLVTVRQVADEAGDPSPFDATAVARRFERQRFENGGNDEGFLLWALLDVIVDRYFFVTDRVDERIDAVEEIVFGDETSGETPREVFDLRRTLVRFRRSAAPLREVVAELLRREADCIGEAAIIRMQDVYDHVLRIIELVESQRELVTGLLEANLAVASNRMNQVMKRMTSWGAILLGSTLIAGIYGMNFQHIPELDWYLGYPLALGMMVALTAVLYTYFKRRDWI
ncbi:MAG TPA: magnesium/cobalt transporter CorA [Acidimicrobiia bacterium]|nr:magnesium/cobalt transporter CorA [Acidimicrobiia bacterium]